MKRQQIIDKWNKEADEWNQWIDLGGDEKFGLLKFAEDCNIKDLKYEFEIE